MKQADIRYSVPAHPHQSSAAVRIIDAEVDRTLFGFEEAEVRATVMTLIAAIAIGVLLFSLRAYQFGV